MKVVVAASVALNIVLMTAGGAVVQSRGGVAYVYAAIERRLDPDGTPQDTPYRLNKRDIYAADPDPHGRLVLLGDSILDLMGNQFFEPGGAVNRAVSGDSTDDVLARLDSVLRYKPRCIAVLIGINDLQGGIIPDYVVSNTELILDRIEYSGANVLLLPLMPVNEAKYRRHIEARSPGVTRPAQTDVEAINAALADMAGARAAVHFVDTYLTGPSGQLADAYTIDGLHLNGAGAKALSGRLSKHLCPSSPDRTLRGR